MSYVPHSRLLHGVPYPVAECYGKPHYLCDYTVKRFNGWDKADRQRAVNSSQMFHGARCMVCGRPATNAHHWPPKGTAPTFDKGGIVLRPALFAVCGSGTTGCHNGFHGAARYRALWRWDTDYLAKEWWEGDLLMEVGEHSNELYGLGCWELYDIENGRIWQVRL